MSKQPPLNICIYAENAQKKFKIPAAVSLAQWIIESGWGAHSPGNNPFGMKPRHGMNDPQQMLMTTEVIKGKIIHEEQPFRLFNTLQDAFLAHAELLATAPVYSTAMKALPSVEGFIREMAGHYATDPLYASKLLSIINSQGLMKYNV